MIVRAESAIINYYAPFDQGLSPERLSLEQPRMRQNKEIASYCMTVTLLQNGVAYLFLSCDRTHTIVCGLATFGGKKGGGGGHYFREVALKNNNK